MSISKHKHLERKNFQENLVSGNVLTSIKIFIVELILGHRPNAKMPKLLCSFFSSFDISLPLVSTHRKDILGTSHPYAKEASLPKY